MTTTTFSAQLLGQTEKTLNAILDRLLAGTDLTEPQWVTLTLSMTLAAGDGIERAELVRRVTGAAKFDRAHAEARVSELVAAGLLQSAGDGSRVTVTEAGRALFGRVRTAVNEITQRLWGDLPPEDLATAGRVLDTVLARANAELATA